MVMAAMVATAILSGCEKEDKDAIDMSVVQKGIDTIDGQLVVDLGFANHLLWATCNLGADSPEKTGNFYAWAETEKKDSYALDNYKWMKDGVSFTKYTFSKDQKDVEMEVIDNKTVMDASDDPAKAALGSRWSTPSDGDFTELVSRCDWRCCKLNGEWGYLFTSKVNGNSIFMPLAGFMDETDNFHIQSLGYYWTTKMSNDTREAKMFVLNRPENNPVAKSEERYLGFPIRPVYK